jgi:N-acetylglutamate synthase-like GNAT family acetyltransferase
MPLPSLRVAYSHYSEAATPYPRQGKSFLNPQYPIMSHSTDAPLIIRPATESDQPRIKEMIRQAQLYPLGLKWQRFIVAEEDGEVVGIVQLKTHWWGTQELGSLAVTPTRQKAGIAASMIHALLAETSKPVYLTCHISLEPFYERFGFRRLSWRELPPDFQGIKLFLLLISPLAHLATKGNFQILIMGRP